VWAAFLILLHKKQRAGRRLEVLAGLPPVPAPEGSPRSIFRKPAAITVQDLGPIQIRRCAAASSLNRTSVAPIRINSVLISSNMAAPSSDTTRKITHGLVAQHEIGRLGFALRKIQSVVTEVIENIGFAAGNKGPSSNYEPVKSVGRM
jgi:hypothetical protein